ncbi:MAG TPA: aminopeptidase, partial [Xanthomonadaceae bacterium]|nr:aminopeptidase [Xanthomonadaceae bacterium]
MRSIFRILPLAALLALAACEREAPPEPTAEQPSAPAAQPAQPPAPDASDHSFGPDISAEDFAKHVQVLSSDAFGGRAPGSRGEQLTVDYIMGQFQRLGLKAPDGESYTQTVPMVQTIPAADATVTLKVGDEATTLAAG